MKRQTQRRQTQRRQAQRRQAPLDTLEVSEAQSYAHQHTVTIESRRRVLEFELNEVERRIVALSAALSNARRDKNIIGAKVRGLTAVIVKR